MDNYNIDEQNRRDEEEFYFYNTAPRFYKCSECEKIRKNIFHYSFSDVMNSNAICNHCKTGKVESEYFNNETRIVSGDLKKLWSNQAKEELDLETL